MWMRCNPSGNRTHGIGDEVVIDPFFVLRIDCLKSFLQLPDLQHSIRCPRIIDRLQVHVFHHLVQALQHGPNPLRLFDAHIHHLLVEVDILVGLTGQLGHARNRLRRVVDVMRQRNQRLTDTLYVGKALFAVDHSAL